MAKGAGQEESQSGTDRAHRWTWGTALAWAAFLFFLMTLMPLVSAGADAEPEDFLSSFTGFCAFACFAAATYWHSRLTEAGLEGPDLVAAMTTVRGVAAAWIVFMLAAALILLGAAVGVIDLFGDDRSTYSDALQEIGALVGPATIIAMSSSGYTEYRRGLREAGAGGD